MPKDTMTSEQRLQTVIDLEVPDRVPVAPMIYHFAARYANISMHDLWSNPAKYSFAIEKCFRELGPWDVYFPINPLNPSAYVFALPMKVKYPGVDLPPDGVCQFIEEELITAHEYEKLAGRGARFGMLRYFDFMLTLACRIRDEPNASPMLKMRIVADLLRHLWSWRRDLGNWKKRGVAILHGVLMEAPFDTLSMARGLLGFSYDLMERPEQLRAAALALSEGYVPLSEYCARLAGVPRVSCLCHRTSKDFMSPRHFRDFAFPSLKKVVNELVLRGVTPVLHCDGNWDSNLDQLHELPKGKFVLQLDGTTNIFRAKEVIGEHCCLFGDVPSTMLAFGGEREVSDYCKKLINVVGRNGGFILAAGCEIPPNARPENVKAMIDAATQLGYYC
jgi:hypothetical protein